MKQTLIAVICGISAWAVALIVELARNAPTTSIWICVVGLALGVLGILDIARRMIKERKRR